MSLLCVCSVKVLKHSSKLAIFVILFQIEFKCEFDIFEIILHLHSTRHGLLKFRGKTMWIVNIKVLMLKILILLDFD